MNIATDLASVPNKFFIYSVGTVDSGTWHNLLKRCLYDY